MRIIVLWENQAEVEYAQNLAQVLGQIAANLAANARVTSDGIVEMFSMSASSLPRVDVVAGSKRSYEAEYEREYRRALKDLAAQAQIPGAVIGGGRKPLWQQAAEEQRAADPRTMKPPSEVRQIDLD
jgi:hypothetical protein